MTAGRIPVPLPFILVVSAVVFLLIFFGAWAVSANSANQSRSLSLEFTGGSGPEFAVATSGEGAESGADAWWEKTLLKACPLH